MQSLARYRFPVARLAHVMLCAGLVAGFGMGAAAAPRIATLLHASDSPVILPETVAETCTTPQIIHDGIGLLIMVDDAERNGVLASLPNQPS